MKTFGIIGGGAWGTALAHMIACSASPVSLWFRDPVQAKHFNQTHENKRYLPGIRLNQTIKAVTNLSALLNSDILIAAVPAQKTRSIIQPIANKIKAQTPLILTSKGIEQTSLKFQSEVLSEIAPHTHPVILSGPSFAQDVARGLPTAIVLAESQILSQSSSLKATEIIKLLGQKTFRPYLSTDPIGVQIGGAVKNVLAIACGIVEGKAFGRSAHAALMTRGFAEMLRLGQSFGVKMETLSGLSGLGDLTLSCFSSQSRNMACGIRLGQGDDLKTILAESNNIEGVATAPALLKLAQKKNVEMPLVQTVHQIITDEKSVDQAIDELLSRPFREEGALGKALNT